MYARADMDLVFSVRGISGTNDCSGLPENYRTCSGHGVCSVGTSKKTCVCEDLWHGDDCSKKVSSIKITDALRSVKETDEKDLEPEAWYYFKLDAGSISNVSSVKIELEVLTRDASLTQPLLLV